MSSNNISIQINWRDMPQKIDVIDRKIAFLLCKNCRISNTAIAKALKLKREVVSYRIKKMRDLNFLTGFVTRINSRKLGMITHFIYLKLKTPAKEKEIVGELIKCPEITNLKNVRGKFDILIEITTKNIEEFDTFLRLILDKYGLVIHEYCLLNKIEERPMDLDLLLEDNFKELGRLKSFKENKGSSYQKEFGMQVRNNLLLKLDELDKQILSIIKSNARINLKEIINKTGSNFPTVHSRIKKLVSEGVVTNFTAFISLAQLGYQMYPVLFNLRSINEQKFNTFLEMHPNILWSHKMVGNWNYQVNIFAKNNDHFQEVLDKLREEFSENIVSFDTMMVFNSFNVVQKVE